MLTEEIDRQTKLFFGWGGVVVVVGIIVLLFIPLGHDQPEGSSERESCNSVMAGARGAGTGSDYEADSPTCAAKRTATVALTSLLAIPATLLLVLAMRPLAQQREEDPDDEA